MSEAGRLVRYWFEDLRPEQWFKADPAVDRVLAERFGELPDQALAGALDMWHETAAGTLALVLVLDQLPRNLYRGTAHAFAYDEVARQVARHAIARGFDHGLDLHRRLFLYLPFEHSEALADQHWAVALITALGDPVYTDYAERHRAVIERFGRFPHRNAALGRASTAAERAYLAEPGAGF
ncbi:MAG: DUF924 domain-containing protein [Geminicoccaceae bacterium]|nr:MAG: DUF924 domain-containing protein [Geminicoccaceae bacterium]